MADFGCTGMQKMLQQGFSEAIRCVLDVFDHILETVATLSLQWYTRTS